MWKAGLRRVRLLRIWAVWAVLLIGAIALSGTAFAVGQRTLIQKGGSAVPQAAWWGFHTDSGDVLHLTYQGPPATPVSIEIRSWTPPLIQDTFASWIAMGSLDVTIALSGEVSDWVLMVHTGPCDPCPFVLRLERVWGRSLMLATGVQGLAVIFSVGATIAIAVATRRPSKRPEEGGAVDA